MSPRRDTHSNVAPTTTSAVGTDDAIAYDVNTAAAKVGLSRSTIYRLINDGELPSAKVRGSRIIMRADLITTLERLKESA